MRRPGVAPSASRPSRGECNDSYELGLSEVSHPAHARESLNLQVLLPLGPGASRR